METKVFQLRAETDPQSIRQLKIAAISAGLPFQEYLGQVIREHVSQKAAA